jgi:WD40 repeat protein/tRNA A-37 threonylcarbamoyl transferase component Bud32
LGHSGPKVKEIFMAALDREPGADRTAYLDEACQGDAELRLRVDVLLRAHERAHEVLGPTGEPVIDEPTVLPASNPLASAEPAPTLAADSDSTAADATRDEVLAQNRTVDATATQTGGATGNGLQRGDRVRYFGDYEIHQELGRGGMGVVYHARQMTLKREVALKMIRAGVLADDVDLRRFQNEAEAVAQLDHPGIVPVYEVGEHQGQRYFSMKLILGGSLGGRLDAYKDDPRAAAGLLAEVAEAVQHAHARGILHRDLKPANIPLDGQGKPYVTDFGLAKKLEASIELTQSGAVMGTPGYMSPEQTLGRRGAVTTASDVYGLGAVLYAVLTGRAPFQGDSVIDTLQAVRERRADPPSRLNRKVSRDLEVICLKALEKDPRRRYASARELADDLNRWRKGEPVTARPVSPSVRAWMWCRRRPAIAGLSVALALVALAGVIAAGTQWRAALRNAGIARRNADDARRNADQAEANARQARESEQEALRRGELLARSNRRLRLADYASRVQLAQREWELGNIARVRALLRELEPAAGDDDLRSFEWHYLRHQCDASASTLALPPSLAGPNTRLTRVDFSPDGTRLLAVARGRLLAWEIPGGRARSLQKDASRSIIDARFSPDGKWLAVLAIALPPEQHPPLGSPESATVFLEIWDLAEGKRLRATELSRAIEGRVVVRPEGRQVAVHLVDVPGSRYYHNTVVLVDPSDGRKQRQPYSGSVPGRLFEFLAYSPDGALLAAPWEQHKAALLDPETGKVKGTIEPGEDIVRDCHFNGDGSRLAFAGDSGRITIWSVPNGSPIQTLRTADRYAGGVRFSPDGRHLASLGPSSVKVWDARTGEYRFLIRGASECLAYSPDGGRIAAGGDGSTIRFWDARREQGALIHKGEYSSYGVAFSPDGLLVARSSGVLLDATTVLPVRTFVPRPGEGWGELVFHPAPSPLRLLASSFRKPASDAPPPPPNAPGDLVLIDVATGRELRRIGGIPSPSFLRFSPDGRWLAARHLTTAEHDSGAVTVLDTTTWKPVFTAPERGHARCNFAFAPDSHRLAVSREGHVVVLDVPSGRELRRIGAFGVSAGALAWSPDGRRLAAAPNPEGPAGHLIRLWDAETGSEAHALPLTAGESIQALSFSPDGRRLASAGFDDQIRIWDTESGLELLTLSGHEHWIWAMSFSPDGRRIVSTSGDRTVRIWDASPPKAEAAH